MSYELARCLSAGWAGALSDGVMNQCNSQLELERQRPMTRLLVLAAAAAVLPLVSAFQNTAPLLAWSSSL